ncbi:MAG: anthranilate synthase component I family protein [Patescibacteria group bacterium]
MSFQYQEFEFSTDLKPFEIFERLAQRCENAFILESLGAESEFSRFTYLGAEPQSVVSDATTDYAALKGLLPHVEGLPPHYHGGLVGYVSYDGTALFEPAFSGKKQPYFPQFEFGLYLDGFIFDKHTQSIRYFTLEKDRRAQFKEMLKKHGETPRFEVESHTSDMSLPQYQEAFASIKEHVGRGDAFQIVFSVGFEYECAGSPVAVYGNLREINPSPHMYCMKFRERYALGASPELLFRTKGHAIEHFGTLAGTIKRGADRQEDERLAAQLKSDEKEVAEHMMLVDLARNDVGRVAEFGSVRVEGLMAVKRYSHVQHLSTEIRGTLRKGLDSFDVLAACAPAGTLTGAPKIEAMKIIAALERSPRGLYGGSVGYFSVNGDAMFAIAIRSLFVSGNKAYTRSGSGIVYDSVCEKEYEEIMNKQRAIQQAVACARV